MPQHSFFSDPFNRVLSTLVLVGIVVALGAYTYFTLTQANQWNTGPTTISVTGTGEVIARPDIAQFSFSVHGEGADAAAAQEKSGTAINAIMEYLKGAGIEEKDIKTEGYNLYPKYTYTEKPCIFGQYCPPGEQVPDGFEVNQTMTVKVRAIDTAGALLSGVGERGATDVSGLGFTIDDDVALVTEARMIAIADAQAQAEVLADSLDVTLVKMVGYYEVVPGESYPMPYAAPMMDSIAGSKSFEAPAVPTGENTTVTKVTLTYEVK